MQTMVTLSLLSFKHTRMQGRLPWDLALDNSGACRSCSLHFTVRKTHLPIRRVSVLPAQHRHWGFDVRLCSRKRLSELVGYSQPLYFAFCFRMQGALRLCPLNSATTLMRYVAGVFLHERVVVCLSHCNFVIFQAGGSVVLHTRNPGSLLEAAEVPSADPFFDDASNTTIAKGLNPSLPGRVKCTVPNVLMTRFIRQPLVQHESDY